MVTRKPPAASARTWRSVVVAGDRIWFDGQAFPGHETLPADVTDFPSLLGRCVARFDQRGLIALDKAAVEALGDPGEVAGWKATGKPAEGWLKLAEAADTGRTVRVALLANVDTAKCPLYVPDDPAATGAALAAWHNLLGQPFALTPGVSGCEVFENMEKDRRGRDGKKVRGPRWHPENPGPRGAAESPYRPSQFDRREADTSPYLHGYDATRQHVAAAGNLLACPEALVHSGPIEFDKALAGWWRIDVPAWNHPHMPDPAGYGERRRIPGPREAGADHVVTRWVTTPTALLLTELAEREQIVAPFQVFEAWTGTGRRLFQPWVQAMEGAYATAAEEDMEEVRSAVKMAGRETIGMFNSESESKYSIFRPDWHFAVIALARCNLWRKMWKVGRTDGRWPLAIDTDCVWYSSDEADPILAAPSTFAMGDKLGQFKHKGTKTRETVAA